MSQTDTLELILSDRKWHSGIFLAESIGGTCAAYRSRIACDLKPRLLKKGLTIFSRPTKDSKIWEYRIGEIGELGI